jgi:hypothetical protein
MVASSGPLLPTSPKLWGADRTRLPLITDDPAVIDTCVLINLLATDRVEEIVAAISPSRLVCPGVSTESLYLRCAEPEGQQEVVDLTPLFCQNIFTGCPMEGNLEEELYVGRGFVRPKMIPWANGGPPILRFDFVRRPFPKDPSSLRPR